MFWIFFFIYYENSSSKAKEWGNFLKFTEMIFDLWTFWSCNFRGLYKISTLSGYKTFYLMHKKFIKKVISSCYFTKKQLQANHGVDALNKQQIQLLL